MKGYSCFMSLKFGLQILLESCYIFFMREVTGYFCTNKWTANWDFQQCCMCDKQRLTPACAYAQIDQSLC